MSRRPGPIPPNATPLVVLAAIVAPIVVRNAKPIVRAMGRATEKAGNFLQRLAEDCPCKDKAEESAPETPVEVAPEPVVEPAPEPPVAEVPKKPAPKRPKKKPAPKKPAEPA